MAASAGAWYRVGTVNVSANSTNVAGIETAWENDVIAIAIGDAFTVDSKTWYEVIAVNGDTSITIDRPFEGSSESSKEYAILRNTSGTILTRLAGQIAVQFNQKQLFLDELRNWLTSEDETATLTDSHGIEHVVKTVNKIQEITGTAASRDTIDNSLDNAGGKVLTTGAGGILGVSPTITSADEAPLGVMATSGQMTNADAANAGFPYIEGWGDSSPVWWNVQSYGYSNRQTQEATQVFPAVGIRGQKRVRVKQDTTWHDWSELLSSNIYNFNTISAANAGNNQYLGRVTKRDAGRLRVFKDLSGRNLHRVTGVIAKGEFGIKRADTGALVFTGILASEMSIDAPSSSRLCIQILNTAASNLVNADSNEYELCPTTADALIELVY